MLKTPQETIQQPKPPATSELQLISHAKACAILGVSKNTLRNWVKDEKAPKPIKFGISRQSIIRYKKSEILAMVEALNGAADAMEQSH
ncbi:MAG TPA: helix-turn-helix domain-containing protein [Cellvibrionaceae bacterium]